MEKGRDGGGRGRELRTKGRVMRRGGRREGEDE